MKSCSCLENSLEEEKDNFVLSIPLFIVACLGAILVFGNVFTLSERFSAGGNFNAYLAAGYFLIFTSYLLYINIKVYREKKHAIVNR